MRSSRLFDLFFGLAFLCVVVQGNTIQANTIESTNKRIFLALLLDTSNSMDGLIDQAKAQLWNIVNELSEAKYDDQPVDLSISLYEYGNDDLSIRSGYIRQITNFTTDLDLISSELFALNTDGGSEYCGAVIKHSLDQLDWGNDPDELKLIFIAGNEPFDQGDIDYRDQSIKAKAMGVEINTIFCGNYQEGIKTKWKNGADLTDGDYLNIDMDQKTIYVSTPHDQEIDQLNDELNKTYVAYGAIGEARKAQQLQEDVNARTYSQSNKVKRTISKSKHIYQNQLWDLVDGVKEGSVDLSKIKKEELPDEMKSMTLEERKSYIQQKTKDRVIIQQKIQVLAKKRQQYVKAYNDSLSISNPLEEVILNSVRKAAKAKSYRFDNQ